MKDEVKVEGPPLPGGYKARRLMRCPREGCGGTGEYGTGQYGAAVCNKCGGEFVSAELVPPEEQEP